MTEIAHRPVALIILDGWGYSPDSQYNAIKQAHTPNWDKWWQSNPHTLLQCSGPFVGLPAGQMGNSEVGHMHIGAGRVINQDFSRINLAIEDQSWSQNLALLTAARAAKSVKSAVHIMGLLSPGGIHSHENHLFAAIKLLAANGAKNIIVHAFLDGRDTPPKSAKASILRLRNLLDDLACGEIGSICGRYFAMDRDKRWDRIEKAYNCIVSHEAEYEAETALSALEKAYDRGETDEFVSPTIIKNDRSKAIQDGDSVIFMNFRADRARQLSQALCQDDFAGFTRQRTPKLKHFITLTQYSEDLPAKVAFPPQSLANSFGEVVAQHGLQQLRIAETEKYAHVTFFFNGGDETIFPGEERELIPSPKVATYDLQPEMSAPELTDKLVAAIESQRFDAIICNYANPDMVGHTGNFPATLHAIECIDVCLGRVAQALEKVGGEMIITADHGNAEHMFNDITQQPHTAHTNTPVPVVYVGRPAKITRETASLVDVAPTMLYLMGLPKPAEMTGESFLEIQQP